MKALWGACLLLLAAAGVAGAVPSTNVALSITGAWRYTTNNVDGVNWAEPGFDDSGLSGPGNGLLYIESATLPAPKNTPLPQKPGGGPMPCYYFRTSVTVTNPTSVTLLIFTNLIDDGAVIYLNGTEIQRVRMSSCAVSYTNLASSLPPGGDATAFETFVVSGDALTNLVDGANVLAARVHQQATTSSDVVFGLAVAVVRDAAVAAQLARGPYLQACTPWSIVIRWRTDFRDGGLVVWGTNLASMTFTNESGSMATEHEVQVTNLAPDTLYYYAVGSTNRMLAGPDSTCYFRTHPLPGTPRPLHLWVIGDAGTKNANQQAVRDAFYARNGTNFVDGWLQLGDNAYDSGTDAEFQAAVFDMYGSLLRHAVTWPTIGNHETYSADCEGRFAYLDLFTLPTDGAAGGIASGTKRYYSFDIGMVHFICLDSMTSSRAANSPMAVWLQEDLAATTNRWVIAYWHHPPYSKGSHNSDTEIELMEMRQNIVPILESGGVDLVLCGHSHSYERSFLLNGHYGLSTSLTAQMILDGGGGRETNGVGAYVKPENYSGTPIGNQGAVYAVAGSSGQISGGTLDHPAMFISLNVLGSMVLDITTNRLEAIFLRETGATNDWFAIIKTNYAPAASNLVFTVPADETSALTLAASDINRNPLTFSAATLPTNGLLSGLDPSSGTLFYTPARGGTNRDSFSFRASDAQLTSAPGGVSINVTAPPDANLNGLPDPWEARYGITDPNGDPDGDGVPNSQEYWAGTNPTNALSWLRIVSINRGQSGLEIVWSAVGGTRYRVLYSDGDSSGFNGVFTALPRSVTEEMDPDPIGTPGTMRFTDDFTLTGGPPPLGRRFFRVQVVK